MPISTPSLLDYEGNNTGSSLTLDNDGGNDISPTGDALLVLIWATLGGTMRTHDSISETFSISGSWVKQVDQTFTASGQGRISIWTVQAASSPGSGTLTATWSGNATSIHLGLIEVASGWDSVTPAETGSGTDTTNTSVSMTMDSAPASDSLIIAGLHSYSGSATTPGIITPGGGFTELYDEAPASSNAHAQYHQDPDDSTVDWSTLDSGVDNTGMAAIEIAAAATGGVVITPPTGPWYGASGRQI